MKVSYEYICLLRFLKSNPSKGINISHSKYFSLKAYVDVDWAKCLISRRSITGYTIFLANSLISWRRKEQETVSCSSIEYEYRALGLIFVKLCGF